MTSGRRKKRALEMRSVLGKIGEIDAVVREHQDAARPYRAPDFARRLHHIATRQIVDHLGDHGDIVARARQSRRNDQPYRFGARLMGCYRLNN